MTSITQDEMMAMISKMDGDVMLKFQQAIADKQEQDKIEEEKIKLKDDYKTHRLNKKNEIICKMNDTGFKNKNKNISKPQDEIVEWMIDNYLIEDEETYIQNNLSSSKPKMKKVKASAPSGDKPKRKSSKKNPEAENPPDDEGCQCQARRFIDPRYKIARRCFNVRSGDKLTCEDCKDFRFGSVVDVSVPWGYNNPEQMKKSSSVAFMKSQYKNHPEWFPQDESSEEEDEE